MMLTAAFVAALGPGSVRGQDTLQVPEDARLRALAGETTEDEVLARLRASGISRSQLRAGLERYGYDPALADRYFDALDGRTEILPSEDERARFESALMAIGIPELPDSAHVTPPWAADSLPDSTAARFASTEDDTGPRLFGLDLFRNLTTQFDADQTGPVDPGYRLGPGDELSLVLTGDVESAWTSDVTREGYVVFPEVGQIFVSGLTIRELEDQLFYHLGQRFSGVRRGPDAPIRFHVGLNSLRTSVIYVIGEAQRPGAYQMTAVASVLKSLYHAGGPNDNASFRSILVRRAGEVVQELDVYAYLLYGDTRDDVRLEHGDVVFLPVTGPRVTVEGAVRRPAIFELRPGEGLASVLEFAGGVTSMASTHRIQIDRVLPPEQRAPGIDRVLLDVDPASIQGEDEVELRDGDVVRVFEVGADRRNRIVLSGEVNRPGVYQWWSGLTLDALIDRAEGLSEQAYSARIHIYRLNVEDGTRSLLRVPAGTRGTRLLDRDSIVVRSVSELANREFVSIEGSVKYPGRYELARSMTIQDLILTAGGFTPGAYTAEAELARQPDPALGADADPTILRVPLGGDPDDGAPEVIRWDGGVNEAVLHAGDHVFIRRAPGYDSVQTVHISGEVQFPGSYALQHESEKIADLFQRAGGPTEEAYVAGARLSRGGHLVATDMEGALRGSNANLHLVPGDSIVVPRYDPTVLVTGAVGFETRVRYEDGRGIDHFIERAGGYADDADRHRTTVTQHNGERRVVNIRRFFFDSKPEPGPGATIYVPAKPVGVQGVNWDRVLTRVLSVATAAATVWLAVDRAGG